MAQPSGRVSPGRGKFVAATLLGLLGLGGPAGVCQELPPEILEEIRRGPAAVVLPESPLAVPLVGSPTLDIVVGAYPTLDVDGVLAWVAIGQRVVSIQGRPPGELGLDGWRALSRDAAAVELVVVGAGGPLKVSLPVLALGAECE